MADKYLKPEQEAQFKQMLAADEAAQNPQTSPEVAPPVEDTAEAPASAAPADTGAPAADPNAALFEELGVSDINELVERYREATGNATEYRNMLSNMLAYQQALNNQQELDPSDPLHSVKAAVREEMGPIYEKAQAEARNKLVQEAWGKEAKNLPDIADVMPEITEFIAQNPDLAVANDGLRRAYDRVRSNKYRTEEQMLADAEFVKRMASNDKVKELVLQNHLGEIARNGESVPASIGSGGGTPLTGQKKAPSSMDDAKNGLAKMLGMK